MSVQMELISVNILAITPMVAICVTVNKATNCLMD